MAIEPVAHDAFLPRYEGIVPTNGSRSNRLMLLLGVLLAVVAFGGVLMFGSKSGSNEAAKPQTV